MNRSCYKYTAKQLHLNPSHIIKDWESQRLWTRPAGREDTSSACCPLSLRAVYVLAFISLMETGVWDGD